VYNNFIGIDIGKFSFVVNLHDSHHVKEYDNTHPGIASFLKDYHTHLIDGLCILETTGGYEMKVLLTLCDKQYAVHRANTRKVKHFIRSYGNSAKTDALDAKGLARYGKERSADLKQYEPPSDNMSALYELVTRRHDLKKMIVAEKNRLQSPKANVIKRSCKALIDALSAEILIVTEEMDKKINQDAELKRKKAVLKTVPGIGEIISSELTVLLPELGRLNRRQVASLAGLAPRANDSGKYSGYRTIGHGRSGIKPSLFLAAMAARNSNSPLKAFYEQLISRGKKKKVALTALMRKIIIIANARVRDDLVGSADAEQPI
jgi:transposase